MAANASPQAPRSIFDLVTARAGILRALARHPSWAGLETRIADGLRAHFAALPPQMQRVDDSTPAVILNQIIRYEAVHEIRTLRELWRRLSADRRCYGLFSRSIPDEPLVFIELALTTGVVADVGTILDPDGPVVEPDACTCAMFYSISSCHEGLRGVPLGGLLIRRVLDRLRSEWPRLQTFATVSPVPGFRSWLDRLARSQGGTLSEIIACLDESTWLTNPELGERVKATLLPLCASYLLEAKRGAEPLDAVARFHLGNGARLERVNWLGDRSAAGLARSVGITANYVYDPSEMDANHDVYGRTHTVVTTPQVTTLARAGAPQAA
jgi:malonyl-CoA decarboxylase